MNLLLLLPLVPPPPPPPPPLPPPPHLHPQLPHLRPPPTPLPPRPLHRLRLEIFLLVTRASVLTTCLFIRPWQPVLHQWIVHHHHLHHGTVMVEVVEREGRSTRNTQGWDHLLRADHAVERVVRAILYSSSPNHGLVVTLVHTQALLTQVRQVVTTDTQTVVLHPVVMAERQWMTLHPVADLR